MADRGPSCHGTESSCDEFFSGRYGNRLRPKSIMLPKKDYMALSAAGKAKVKAGLRRRPKARGRPAAYRRIRGHGGYMQDIGAKMESTFGAKPFSRGGGALGGALGSMIPIPGAGAAGSWLGSKLGGFIGKIFGSGAYVKTPSYSVRKNSLVAEGNPVPQFGSSGHATIVRHREFLQDISGSTAFTIQAFPINVGLVTSFPWLAAIAQNYEEYVVSGLVFEFVSTSADALNSTNTALGSVILATEYNSANANFVNKQQMLEYEFATSGKPSEHQCHIVECARRETVLSELYVRAGAVPTGQDQRLYDLGNFQLATVGMQATAVIGELWCSYEVILIKPRLVDAAFGAGTLYAHYQLTSASTSNYFGTSQTMAASQGMTLTFNAGAFIFPPQLSEGAFQVTVVYTGGSTALTVPTFTGTNAVLVKLLTSDTVSSVSNTGQTTTSLVYTAWWQISGLNASIAASGGTLPTSVTSADLILSQIPVGAT